MRYFVFDDPNWDFKSWDYEKDMPKVEDAKIQAIMDSSSTNLNSFRQHGDKLILYQGWGDEAISPLNTIRYYKSVVAKATGDKSAATAKEDGKFDEAVAKAGDFARLFMVPGMDHCFGGPGPNVFDSLSALASWVENKQAPAEIIATHSTKGTADRTRPLCPYPQTAQYSGSGSIDDAANFSCKMPKAN
jgi:feruloyl esterase